MSDTVPSELVITRGQKVILVLGLTGAGKSSFIQHFTSEDVPRGDGSLNPQTLDIKAYPTMLGDESVVLVDTPGIDYPGYTYLNIAVWMSEAKPEPIKSVYGIIFLYPIDHNLPSEELKWSAGMREEFSDLLGVSITSSCPFYRVILATTRWNTSSDSEYVTQTTSETRLVNNWSLLEQQGATIRRSEDTAECAKEIVEAILTAEPLDVKTISARNRIVIAVIGAPQAGKSSLIRAATNDPWLLKNLRARALSDLHTYETKINNENVLLIDTPGIDSASDLEKVSRLLSQWLKEQAKLTRTQNVYLDGIIFVHPINPPPGQKMIQQMHMVKQFNKLLGNLKHIRDEKDVNAYQRVVLATTMWDKVGAGDESAAEREKVIRGENWNVMEIAGSCMARFDNTTKSARGIVEQIVEAKKSGDPAYQHHMVMQELTHVRSELKRIGGDLAALRKGQDALRTGQEAIARVPELDKLIAAACNVVN